LQRGIDSDRPDAADWITFVQKIATNDPAIGFGNKSEKTLMVYQYGEHAGRHVRSRKIGLKIARFRDSLESAITDIPGGGGICLRGPAQF